MADRTRQRQLARIHCLKRDLGLDDDTYRDVLENVAKVRSAGELDASGRLVVIRHLQQLAARRGVPDFPGRPTNFEQHPGLAKVDALLADSKRPWTYAHAIAQRMYGVDRVQWCNDGQISGVIAALAKDRDRRRARELAAREEE